MVDIGINWDAFPAFADAGALEAAADRMRERARSFAQILWDNRDTWKGLAPHFESPDTDTLLAALNPNEQRADDVFLNTNTVARALDEFAATERTLEQEKATLRGDYDRLVADIGGNEEWTKDEDLTKRQQAILDGMNGLISRHQTAEMTCANAINALYGGTRYVQVSADGSAPPAGSEAYGMSREMLNSASGAGETPWGRPAAWDKPWYLDVADAVVDFGSGVWESLKGTVTGLIAMVNPFDWETFSATWKGIGTLAVDLAVTATPVGLLVSDERRAQSGQRLVQVVEAVLNVEMWKENPAKAAGMLTGDLATALVPGGAAVKGASVAAKSGKAASVLGKVKHAGAGAREMATMAKFKAEDFARGFSDKKFAVTDALHSKASAFAYRHPQVGAMASTMRTVWEFDVDKAAKVFSDGMLAKVPAVGVLADGGVMWVKSGESFSSVMSRAVDAGMAPVRSGGGGLPAGVVEGKGTMVMRPSPKWDLSTAEGRASYEAFAGKVDQYKQFVSSPERLGFTKLEARTIKRSDYLKDPDFIMRKVADEDGNLAPALPKGAEDGILRKLQEEMRDHNASKGTRTQVSDWHDLPQYKQERAVRAAMKGFDLDHARDLQLGGKDEAENLQWLDKSANRSAGSQVRHHRDKYGYSPVDDLDALSAESHDALISRVVMGEVRR